MHCEDANASAALCGLGVKKDCYCGLLHLLSLGVVGCDDRLLK